MARLQIFLSAVSAEFGSYRNILRRDLDSLDVSVKVQEDFVSSGSETLDKLDAYIRQCDAVIHLVGDMTGAMAQAPSLDVIRSRYPDFAERLPAVGPNLTPGGPPLSYTQWEAWLALYHGKELIIAEPEPGAARDAGYVLDESQRAAQMAHLAGLNGMERFTEIRFANVDRLAVAVLRGRPFQPRIRARHDRWLAALSLLGAIVGGAIWHFFRPSFGGSDEPHGFAAIMWPLVSMTPSLILIWYYSFRRKNKEGAFRFDYRDAAGFLFGLAIAAWFFYDCPSSGATGIRAMVERMPWSYFHKEAVLVVIWTACLSAGAFLPSLIRRFMAAEPSAKEALLALYQMLLVVGPTSLAVIFLVNVHPSDASLSLRAAVAGVLLRAGLALGLTLPWVRRSVRLNSD